jgi:hypothetical protein
MAEHSEEEILLMIAALEAQRAEDACVGSGQTGDAVADSALVVASAPAVAAGELDLATTSSLGTVAHDATARQAAGYTQLHTSTVLAAKQLLELPRRRPRRRRSRRIDRAELLALLLASR